MGTKAKHGGREPPERPLRGLGRHAYDLRRGTQARHVVPTPGVRVRQSEIPVEHVQLLPLAHVVVIVHPLLAKDLRHHPLLVLGKRPGVDHEDLIAGAAHVVLVVRLREDRGNGSGRGSFRWWTLSRLGLAIAAGASRGSEGAHHVLLPGLDVLSPPWMLVYALHHHRHTLHHLIRYHHALQGLHHGAPPAFLFG